MQDKGHTRSLAKFVAWDKGRQFEIHLIQEQDSDVEVTLYCDSKRIARDWLSSFAHGKYSTLLAEEGEGAALQVMSKDFTTTPKIFERYEIGQVLTFLQEKLQTYSIPLVEFQRIMSKLGWRDQVVFDCWLKANKIAISEVCDNTDINVILKLLLDSSEYKTARGFAEIDFSVERDFPYWAADVARSAFLEKGKVYIQKLDPVIRESIKAHTTDPLILALFED